MTRCRPKPSCMDALIILGVATIFYGFKLGSRSFENHDHLMFASIASKMMETRDWLVMHTGGDVYANKPHLLFWSICLFSLPYGEVTPFTARLPCALSAVGSCVVTFLFARSLFSRRAAYLASFILMGTWAFSWNAQRVRFDIMLTFFTLLALFLLYTGYRKYESGGDGRRYYFFSGLAIALSVMVKGPLGLFLTLMPFVIFLVVRKRFSVHVMKLAYAIVPLVFLIGIWFFVYFRAVGAKPLSDALFHDTIAHVVDKSDQGPRGPFYYYLVDIPLKLAPWSIFFPVVAAFLFRLFSRERPENYLFLLVWIASVVVMLSLAYSKFSRYSFPIYPALTMMVAGVAAARIDDEDSMQPWARRLADSLAAWVGVGMSMATIASLVVSLLVEQYRWLFWVSLLFAAIALPLALGVPRAAPRKRFARGLMLMITFMLFFNWAYIAFLSAYNDKYSPMTIAYGKLKNAIEDGRVSTYNFSSSILEYYSKTRIPRLSDPSELDSYMSNDSPVYCLITESDLMRLPDATKRDLIPLEKLEARRDETFVIVSNESPEQSWRMMDTKLAQ